MFFSYHDNMQGSCCLSQALVTSADSAVKLSINK